MDAFEQVMAELTEEHRCRCENGVCEGYWKDGYVPHCKNLPVGPPPGPRVVDPWTAEDIERIFNLDG